MSSFVRKILPHKKPTTPTAAGVGAPGFAQPGPSAMGQFGEHPAPHVPVDVLESDQEYLMVIDIPAGVSRSDVKVSIDAPNIQVWGQKTCPSMYEQYRILGVERSCGRFERSIPFPSQNIVEQNITAQLENNILTLRLPKRAGMRPGAGQEIPIV